MVEFGLLGRRSMRSGCCRASSVLIAVSVPIVQMCVVVVPMSWRSRAVACSSSGRRWRHHALMVLNRQWCKKEQPSLPRAQLSSKNRYRNFGRRWPSQKPGSCGETKAQAGRSRRVGWRLDRESESRAVMSALQHPMLLVLSLAAASPPHNVALIFAYECAGMRGEELLDAN